MTLPDNSPRGDVIHHRPLGRTGLAISAVAFGAGPVPGLLTSPDPGPALLATVQVALDAGINWFDTAATYGEGRSEAALGAAFRALGVGADVHVATKVRIDGAGGGIREQVRETVGESLRRLGRDRVTLLQLHNSITTRRGDLPTSITPEDIIGPGGILESFEAERRAGRIEHFGLTALGDAPSLRIVLETRAFVAAQVPYNVLTVTRQGDRVDDGAVVNLCHECGAAVLAIRVLAGGALAGHEPSEHTRRTKFFPLALYEADRARAAQLATRLPAGMTTPEAAVRFVLSRPSVTSAIIGFSTPEQVAEAERWATVGPLPGDLESRLIEDA